MKVTVLRKGCVVKVRSSHALASSCVVLLLLLEVARAQEAAFEVLHEFNPATGGRFPTGALVQAYGSLYGTTKQGGASDLGTIFKLDSKGVLTILRSFQGSDGANLTAS